MAIKGPPGWVISVLRPAIFQMRMMQIQQVIPRGQKDEKIALFTPYTLKWTGHAKRCTQNNLLTVRIVLFRQLFDTFAGASTRDSCGR